MVNTRLLKERVEECAKTGGHVLDLQNMGLTLEDAKKLLPEIVKRFPNLRRLDLSGNELTELPESAGNLKSLNELNLENNPLVSLPLGLINLSNLTNFNLRNTRLSMQSLLYVSTISPLPGNLGLSTTNQIGLNRIFYRSDLQDKSNFAKIAMSVGYTFSNASVEAFLHLYDSLNDAQRRGILELSLPPRELGIGLDAQGVLINDLETDIPIAELIAKTELAVKSTGLSNKVLQSLKMGAPGYLQEIANHDALQELDSGKKDSVPAEDYKAVADLYLQNSTVLPDLQHTTAGDAQLALMTQPQNMERQSLTGHTELPGNLDRKPKARNVTEMESKKSNKRPKNS